MLHQRHFLGEFPLLPEQFFHETSVNSSCWQLLKYRGSFSLQSFRSSHQRWSIRKGVLRNLTKFTGKHMCQGLFLNTVAGLRHRCYSVNFVKFLRTPFLQNTSGRLLLEVHFSWSSLAQSEPTALKQSPTNTF